MARRSLVSRPLHGSPESGLPPTAWLAGIWSPAHCMVRRSLVSRLLLGSPEPGLPPTVWLAGAWSPAYYMARQSLVSRLLHGSPEPSLPPTAWLTGIWSHAYCMARRRNTCSLLSAAFIATQSCHERISFRDILAHPEGRKLADSRNSAKHAGPSPLVPSIDDTR
ncbi:hypothetical protein PoB_004173200 [Plakobranchus ocellatus]|uniref:Uncharacterized protein n=1 Tax=Plakobranchus ocellatus TaxID=259542 RepID=A0AAV4B800_9GAST|nr:hypothetical protein PoB_004173200 [Plakobranchus ocellatus]